ncbi:hypothetical protein LSTR_LSTR004148 [Laodelphax striatellus]|uniref:Chitin-binding type-2 domain-containing protein n=1 Tax=Laodelphax striatellus TaxID=195883 RepID=A0A482XA22_LAOST|nr:hypothetical protein LSTR_LSTR004148 [Laodelphax striatellus]
MGANAKVQGHVATQGLLVTHILHSRILSSTMRLVVLLAFVMEMACAGHYYNADGTPHDPYHYLHLPHDPPLYPTFHEVPLTSFSCAGREWGYHADTEAYCQAYHLCQGGLVRSFLCTNGTLFHDEFQVCDQFYNVRCGSPYSDL